MSDSIRNRSRGKRSTTHAFGKRKKKFHGKTIGDGRRKRPEPPAYQRFESFQREFQETGCDPEECFIILSFGFMDAMMEGWRCHHCEQAGKCKWTITKKFGLACEIAITCEGCGKVNLKKFTSKQKTIIEPDTNQKHEHFQINTRWVFAAQKTTIHFSKFTDLLSLSGLSSTMSQSTYQKILKLVFSGSQKSVVEGLEEAREIVKSRIPPNPVTNLVDTAVSFDGSWHKRGHTSKYGIAFCIEPTTRIILDYMVVSNYCRPCSIMKKKLEGQEFDKWKENHDEHCNQNYHGSSNNMETYIAKEIWKRSEEYGFRYTTLIGDGDASVYSALSNLKLYDGETISKSECINHVGKRMRKRLDKAVADERVKGHTMGGVGKLTDDRRKRWANYFRNAIVGADGNAEKASKAVWAILYHNCHSKEEPMHQYCDISWCFYLQARERGEEGPIEWQTKHKKEKPITKKMFDALKPKFESMADVNFLSKCMALHTQNANESLHSTIWNKCSKAHFIGKKYLDSVVADCVTEWNKGATSIISVGDVIGIPLSPTVHKIARHKDTRRMADAAKLPLTVANRKRRRMEQAAAQKRLKEAEGVTYEAGAF